MRFLRWYPFLVSVLSLLGGGFCAFFLLPRNEAVFQDLGGREWALHYPFFDFTYRVSAWAYEYSLFWFFVALTAGLFLGPLFPAMAEDGRKRLGWAFQAWSLLLLALGSWFMIVAAIGSFEATMTQESKLRSFESVLNEFALRESAEGRYEDFNRRMQALSKIEPVRIVKAEELSVRDRNSRAFNLCMILVKEESPAMRKKILTTLLLFRKEVKTGTKATQVVEAANEVTGKKFANSEEFFTWLEPQVGKDGWEAVPVFRFQIGK